MFVVAAIFIPSGKLLSRAKQAAVVEEDQSSGAKRGRIDGASGYNNCAPHVVDRHAVAIGSSVYALAIITRLFVNGGMVAGAYLIEQGRYKVRFTTIYFH